jgi:hypothetical protein
MLVWLPYPVTDLDDHLLLREVKGGEWIVMSDPGPTVLFTQKIERCCGY